ncbi:MAG TPA: EAL domain-containing protein [Steroidobacteraceae bacterium]|nr:EAL domain-containing protein [Steroidobacteraceae bacterium]
MSEQTAVPLIVLSATRDPVEVINSALRKAGHAAHCTWIPALRDLGDALTQLNPDLILHFEPSSEDLVAAVAVRDQLAPLVPLIVVDDSVTEGRIADGMAKGARDVVSSSSPERLQAVLTRELRSHRIERALENTLRTARDARRQLASVLQHSNDAIAQVQEGILVDANSSWLELFGYELGGIAGQPVMDYFEETTHAALKGALAACLQGRWSNHPLSTEIRFADGAHRPFDLVLALGEHDGEPCVQLIIASRKNEAHKLEEVLADAMRRDPASGLLYRTPLLAAVYEQLAEPVRAGVRYFAVVKPDKFATVERDVGLTASEDVLCAFTAQVREGLHANEIIGHLGGTSLLVLLERGNEHDIEAWGAQLVARVARQVVAVAEKTLSITCSVGLSVAPSSVTRADTDAAIADALDACTKAQARAGNQVALSDKADNDTRVKAYDQVWVKHIKAALMENRFRLVQQPIASLQGGDQAMFDVLLRMLDTNGKEVLPGEFMPAAERNDLLKNIDRWVVGASLSFAAQRKPTCLFVRLSHETLKDASFLGWVDNQIRATRSDPHRLCFQAHEDIVATQLDRVQKLSTELRSRGFKFAIERFGSGRDPKGLLESTAMDFVKIDGALVQALTSSPDMQQKVRTLVEQAKSRNIETIAERVEDANTMAVLWQLGVQYIQGYLVHAPEEIVLRG